MQNVILVGGGHGDKSTSLVRQLLCQHSTISQVGQRDTFLIESIAILVPYLATEAMFYLPRVSSLKYVEFRQYIADMFGVNAQVRHALDNLEAVLAPQSIYVPRFGHFPLVQPLKAELRRDLFSKFIKDVFGAALKNPYAALGCERTPNNAQYLPTIYEYLPEAKVIIVDRDPLSVAQSIRIVDWGPENATESAHYVRRYYEQWFAVRAQVPDNYYLTIRYDDLVTDTDKILSQLFTYLEVKIEPEVRDFATDLAPELNPCLGIEAKECEAMRTLLRDVRQRLGYA